MDSTHIIAFVVIMLLIWGPWLWRYRIKPRFAKDSLTLQLQQRPDWKDIKKTERLLTTLFKPVNAGLVSRQERKRLGIEEDAFIYGEIQFLSFFHILDKVKPRSGEIFYDLGSGAGKPVFAAALFFDFAKAYGVERLPALFTLANAQVTKLLELIKSQDADDKFLRRASCIEFINDDFLNVDFSDGDVIFINATCLSYHTWEAILKKLLLLKMGSRVILTTKKIQDEKFKLLQESLELMSWGVNSVHIYEKAF